MLGKRIEGLDSVLMERVDNLVIVEVLKWWEKKKDRNFGWNPLQS